MGLELVFYSFLFFLVSIFLWLWALRRRLNFPKFDVDLDAFQGIVGHRGCRVEEIPENSMFSFTYALDAGLEGIEVDVRLTKDKKAVVFHDDTITRVLNGQGYCSELTWDELQKIPFLQNTKHLRLADGWKKYVSTHLPGESVDRVPSMEQVFLFAKRYNLKLVIDLKEVKDRLRLYTEIIFLFKKYDLYSKAVVAAFNPWDLYFFKKCGAADVPIATCLLYSRNTLQWYHDEGGKEIQLPWLINFRLSRFIVDELIVLFALQIAEMFGAHMIGPDWDLLSRELIDVARKRGIGIYTWTVNGNLEKRYFSTFKLFFATDNHVNKKQDKTERTEYAFRMRYDPSRPDLDYD